MYEGMRDVPSELAGLLQQLGQAEAYQEPEEQPAGLRMGHRLATAVLAKSHSVGTCARFTGCGLFTGCCQRSTSFHQRTHKRPRATQHTPFGRMHRR